MAIRQMDISLFDKIANSSPNTEVEEKVITEENYISEEDMQYLYDKGMDELKMFMGTLETLKHFILDMFCGSDILSTEEALNFFCSMEMFAKELIPAMLVGDEEEIYKYCSEEITSEDLELSREEFFQSLYKKYLQR